MTEPKVPRCSDMHMRPNKWIHRGGKAYCPLCGKYKGRVVELVTRKAKPTKEEPAP